MDLSTALRYSRSLSIGSYDAYLDLDEPSSFDLLRSSILRSISKRSSETEGFLEKTYNGVESAASQPSKSKYTVIEEVHFDRNSSRFQDDVDSDISDTEKKCSLPEETTKTKQLEPSNEITLNSLSIGSSESTKENSNSQQTASNDSKMQEDLSDEFKIKEESVANGLKLASRKFNETIFSDCSTYDITCNSVNLEKKENKTRAKESVNQDFPKASSSSKSDASLYSKKKTLLNYSNEYSYEQNSLSDTFFPNIVSEGNQSPSTSIQLVGLNPVDNRSSLVEKHQNTDELSHEEVPGGTETPPKRKYSKRHRKRSRRKSKTRKTYVYECSKCGVSYIIPTKAMHNVACCLHCDLWTPVEPVFLKREKQTWNSCGVS